MQNKAEPVDWPCHERPQPCRVCSILAQAHSIIFPSRLLIPISQITSQLTALGSTSVRLGLFLRDPRLKHQHRLVQLSTMRTVNPDVLGPQSLLGLNGDSTTMIQVIFGEGSGDGERLDVVSRQIGRIRTLRRSRGRRWRAAALALALALILGRVRVAVLRDRLTHGSLL